MNRESNKHTYIFATIMVVSVASVLSFTSESLKDLQNANIKKEKMQNILSSVGINVSRDESESLYGDYVKEELSLKSDGSVDAEVNAFNINLALEVKKDKDEVNTNTYDNSMDEFENIEEYYAIKEKEKQNEKKVTTEQTWNYATEVTDDEIEGIIK